MVQAVSVKLNSKNLLSAITKQPYVLVNPSVSFVQQDNFVRNYKFEESLLFTNGKYVGTINDQVTVAKRNMRGKDGYDIYDGSIGDKKFNFKRADTKKKSIFEGTFNGKDFCFEYENIGGFFREIIKLTGKFNDKPVGFMMQRGKPAEEFNYNEDTDILLLTLATLGLTLGKNKNSEITLIYSKQKQLSNEQEANTRFKENMAFALMSTHQ